MKKISVLAQLILGVTFVFGGVNGLMIPLGLEAIVPVNPQSKFAILLSQTNYIFIVQKVIELLAGICLLIRKFRLAAILALTPIVICIVMYHLFDDIKNIVIGITVLLCYVISLFNYADRIKWILKDEK